MKWQVRIGLYVGLTACGLVLGYKLYQTYRQHASSTPVAVVKPAATPTNAQPTAAEPTPPLANPAPATPAEAESDLDAPVRPSGRWLASMVTYAVLLAGVLVGLGLLIGRDVSHFTAHKVEELLFDDEGEGLQNQEYEQAEELWKQGRHLDAVQLMRDYYQRNPREVYVALRIAEIYEKDLNNPLAAALEYEEILKRKLPPDRWGWTAIHLANLYSGKLNKTAQAIELLERIVTECGDTAPARKARERLEALRAEHPELVKVPPLQPTPPPSAPPPPSDSGPKLPPGFRPLNK
jgi:TolA-binding protein